MCAVFRQGTGGLIARAVNSIALIQWMFRWKKNLAVSYTEAEAIILNVHLPHDEKNNGRQIILQIQVQPDKGRNFIAEMKTSPAKDIAEGKKIKVIYDPSNLKDMKLVTQ